MAIINHCIILSEDLLMFVWRKKSIWITAWACVMGDALVQKYQQNSTYSPFPIYLQLLLRYKLQDPCHKTNYVFLRGEKLSPSFLFSLLWNGRSFPIRQLKLEPSTKGDEVEKNYTINLFASTVRQFSRLESSPLARAKNPRHPRRFPSWFFTSFLACQGLSQGPPHCTVF